MTRFPSRLRRPVSAAALGAAALGSAVACERERDLSEPVPLVVATIFPVGDLAAHIGGEDVRVEVLVPPHADPSTYEPSPRQIRALAGGRDYLTVGGALDAWVRTLPGGLGLVAETRLNDGIMLWGGDAERGRPPYVARPPARARRLAAPDGRRVGLRPPGRLGSGGGAGGRAVRLSHRARRLTEPAACPGSAGHRFISAHAAWGYMADRYGVRELASIYPGPGREPSERRLAALIDSARGGSTRWVAPAWRDATDISP